MLFTAVENVASTTHKSLLTDNSGVHKQLSCVNPASRQGDGLFPTRQSCFAAVCAPRRFKNAFHLPVTGIVLRAVPEPCRQPRQAGRAQRGGFGGARAHDGYAEQVGLHLHQQIVASGPAVGARDIVGDDKVCKVSIVGIGMRSHAGVASLMFRTLSEEGINIQMISTSEIKTSVVINDKYMELAVRALHKAFGLDQEPSARPSTFDDAASQAA